MSRPTLPSAVTASLQAEDYYDTTLAQPLAAADTDIFPETMPSSVQAFGVLDPDGDAPEIVFWTSKGANYVRCPSATDGQGRGVFQTTPADWDSGTKFGVYTVSAYLEAIVTGVMMQDGFLQPRHFSSGLDPNAWVGTGESWTYGASNTQKEFTYVIAGDKTGKYSAGMRLKLPRVTDTGSQCATFVAGSSQYASKSSPSGITFTDDFTVEAWVKLNSYAAMVIASRGSGTPDGWSFEINSSGQPILKGRRAADDAVTSRQHLPLGRKVHVAMTLDSSGGIGTIFIDGVGITGDYTNNGNTAIAQGTGDLTIGKSAAGNYFDGEISDVRVWSVVRTPSQIKDNYHKRLVGNETNLVAYYKLNGNFNDSTANANNLTASGAIATTTDCPFSATEYGVITGVVYAAGSTTITVFTGQGLAPAEDLSNISYSSSDAPLGFPADRWFWTIEAKFVGSVNVSNTSTAQYGSEQIILPGGSWDLRAQYGVYAVGNATAQNCTYGLSTATGSFNDDDLKSSLSIVVTSVVCGDYAAVQKPVRTSSMMTYYMVGFNSTGALTSGLTGVKLSAVCGYI